MKVIKEGKLHIEVPKQITCRDCESVLEYTKQDITTGQYNEPIIICPVCGGYIDV